MIDAAQGCLVGLAVGDALGQPTEGWTPDAIRERWGRIDDFLDPTAAVSDDTEYTLFSARLLLRYGPALTSDDVAREWLEQIVPQPPPFKGAGFSEMAAIDNLRRGLTPPASGRHYHSWSDGLAMRVAPFGIYAAGRPAEAARLAVVDGAVSHAGEGLLGGVAVAAAVALAMAGRPLDEVVAGARAAVPADSWTGRNLALAETIGGAHPDPWSALEALHEALAVVDYPWMDLAPEAVGLAFGLLVAGRGDFRETVLAAVNLGRDADTVAAVVGAVLGALHGYAGLPERWRARVAPAEGRCLACVRGLDPRALAADLVLLHERGVAVNAVEGALYAMAMAESLLWSGAYQRAALLPFWTRRKRREIEAEGDRAGRLDVPLPFALNQSPEGLRAAPGPHSEWLIFSLQICREAGERYSRDAAVQAWRQWVDPAAGARLSIGQRSTVRNLAAGKEPPASGHDNPHFFDDAAAVRAVAFGLVGHDVDAAVACAERDAEISNAEDGVWAAKAVAAAIATACRGESAARCVEAAVACLPEGSWIRDEMARCEAEAERARSPLELALRLDRRVANHAYSYGDAAAETVPQALTLYRFSGGDAEAALLGALALPRSAASVAPLLGALGGAAGRLPIGPDALRELLPTLVGVSLPHLRGVDLGEFARPFDDSPRRLR